MPSRLALELELLQFLCDPRADLSARRALLRILADYCWLDADHEVLFDCIGGLLPRDAQHILAHIPAAATLRGFPHISCDSLAAGSALDAPSALARARDLLHAPRSSLDTP